MPKLPSPLPQFAFAFATGQLVGSVSWTSPPMEGMVRVSVWIARSDEAGVISYRLLASQIVNPADGPASYEFDLLTGRDQSIDVEVHANFLEILSESVKAVVATATPAPYATVSFGQEARVDFELHVLAA